MLLCYHPVLNPYMRLKVLLFSSHVAISQNRINFFGTTYTIKQIIYHTDYLLDCGNHSIVLRCMITPKTWLSIV